MGDNFFCHACYCRNEKLWTLMTKSFMPKHSCVLLSKLLAGHKQAFKKNGQHVY